MNQLIKAMIRFRLLCGLFSEVFHLMAMMNFFWAQFFDPTVSKLLCYCCVQTGLSELLGWGIVKGVCVAWVAWVFWAVMFLLCGLFCEVSNIVAMMNLFWAYFSDPTVSKLLVLNIGGSVCVCVGKCLQVQVCNCRCAHVYCEWGLWRTIGKGDCMGLSKLQFSAVFHSFLQFSQLF